MNEPLQTSFQDGQYVMMHGLESIFDIYMATNNTLQGLYIFCNALVEDIRFVLSRGGRGGGGMGWETPMPYGKVADALDLSYGYKSTALVSLRVFTIKHHQFLLSKLFVWCTRRPTNDEIHSILTSVFTQFPPGRCLNFSLLARASTSFRGQKNSIFSGYMDAFWSEE